MKLLEQQGMNFRKHLDDVHHRRVRVKNGFRFFHLDLGDLQDVVAVRRMDGPQNPALIFFRYGTHEGRSVGLRHPSQVAAVLLRRAGAIFFNYFRERRTGVQLLFRGYRLVPVVGKNLTGTNLDHLIPLLQNKT